MFGIQCRRQGCLHLAAIDHDFQFAGRLLMILDHLLRKRLGVGIGLLRERELTRLDFEHVADRDLVHEVRRRRGAGGRRGLGKRNRGE